MNADGSGQLDVTKTPAAVDESRRAISPSGSAESSSALSTAPTETDIISDHECQWVGRTDLTPTPSPVPEFNPVFSPDETRIAFERCPDLQCDILLMNPDGSSQVNLTNTGGSVDEESPDWEYVAPSATCTGKQATIVGTNRADQIIGTPGADVIVGLDGNDKLSGLAGNDLICGVKGNDTLKGGAGNDKLQRPEGQGQALRPKGQGQAERQGGQRHA